jgi:hypothetical protein
MGYLEELIDLDREWRELKISGEEYAKALKDVPAEMERKRNDLLSYRKKMMDSNLTCEEKEKRLKEIRDNLGYLEDRTNLSHEQDGDSKMLTGILIGGLIAFIGMYLLDRMGNYLKESLSEGVSEGIYSGLRQKGI